MFASRIGAWLPAVSVAGVALVLLYLSVPRLAATLWEIRFDDVAAAAERGVDVPPAQLQDAAEGLQQALRWTPSRAVYLKLAMLQQALAKVPGASVAEQHLALESALSSIRAGLAMAPVDPSAWSRLGLVLMRLGRPREALDAIRFSTVIAAQAPAERWWRLELWLLSLRYLEQGDVARLRRQLDLAFAADAGRLARLAKHYHLMPWVREELATAGHAAEQLDPYFPVPSEAVRNGADRSAAVN